MALIASAIAWAAIELTVAGSALEAVPPSQDPTSGRVGIVPMATTEDIDAGLRDILEASLVEGLGRDAAVDATRLQERDRACSDACWNQQAIEQGATHVVVLSVQVHDRRYRINLELRDATTGQELASVTRDCDVCGLADVQALIESEAAKLPQNVVDSRRPALLVITTTPAEASVSLDGLPIGTSPLVQRVEAGSHHVLLEKPGYATVERSVVAEPGVRQRISVRLSAAQSAVSRPWLRPVGIAAAVVGVATVGASVPLFVLEERPVARRCHGASVNDDGLCRWRYRTLEGGVALALVGTGAVAAGIALLVSARRSRQATTTSWAAPRLRLASGGSFIPDRRER